MNKKKVFIILLAVVIAIVAGCLLFNRDNTEYVDAANEEDVRWAYELLSGSLNSAEIMYCDYLEYADEKNGTGCFTANAGETTVINYKESITYTVNAETAGWYYLSLDYKPMSNALSDCAVDVR